MTPNHSLSIPNALKAERPDDYYKNTATIEWPSVPPAGRFPSKGALCGRGLQGRQQRRHRQGVRSLPRGRGLAHALFRFLRRARPAVDSGAPRQPFWLDPSDPHRMAVAMQAGSPAGIQLHRSLGRSGVQPWSRSASGRRPSTGSPPTASAPRRRSTRRSPGSSRSWRSSQPGCEGVRALRVHAKVARRRVWRPRRGTREAGDRGRHRAL